MDDDTGDMKVKAETMTAARHLTEDCQLDMRRQSEESIQPTGKHTFLDYLGHWDRPSQGQELLVPHCRYLFVLRWSSKH